jgi:hypothetical protein
MTVITSTIEGGTDQLMRFGSDELYKTPAAQSLNSLNGLLHVPAGLNEILLYGPYIALPDGVYECSASLDGGADDVLPRAAFDIIDDGRVIGSDLFQRRGTIVFSISNAKALEIRLHAVGDPFVFLGFELRFVRGLPALASQVDRELLVAIETGNKIGPESINFSTQSTDLAAKWHEIHYRPHCLINSKNIEVDEGYLLRKKAALKVFDVWGDAGVGFDEELTSLGLNTGALRANSFDNLSIEIACADLLREPLAKLALERLLEARKELSPTSEFLSRLASFQRGYHVTGAVVSSFCPIGGQVVASRHSIPVPDSSGNEVAIAYLFQGVEPFYVITAGWYSTKAFIYMPIREIAFSLNASYSKATIGEITGNLRRVIFENLQSVGAYISAPTIPTLLVARNANFGHHLWNEIGGWIDAKRFGWFSEVNQCIAYKALVLEPSSFGLDMTLIRCAGPNELFASLEADGAFLVKPSALLLDGYHQEQFRQAANASSTVSCRETIGSLEDTTYVIWANLRSHTKVWVEQIEGIFRLSKAAAKRHRNVVLFVDGTPDCAELLTELRLRLTPDIIVVDGLGISVSDSILWADRCNIYVAPIGSGLTLVTWIVSKPGVAHAETHHLKQMEFWKEVRLDSAAPLTPDPQDVLDLGSGAYCNYSIDPAIIERLFLTAGEMPTVNDPD